MPVTDETIQPDDAIEPPGNNPESQSLSPQPPRRRMRRGTRALIFITVLSVVVVNAMWLLTPRRYMSTGVVRVDSPTPPMPLTLGTSQVVPLDIMNRWVADQMFRVCQPDILMGVLQDSDVVRTSWYRSAPDKILLLEELESDLDIQQAPDANAFVVSFSTRACADAKIIVERVIDLYLRRMDADSKAHCMGQLTGVYQKQLDELKSKRELVEQQKRALAGAQQGGVTGLVEGMNIDSERLRGLLAESARAEAGFALIQSQWQLLRITDPSQLESTPAVLAVLDDDQEVINLKLDIRKAKRALTNLRLKDESDSKEARALDQQIQSLQAEMKDLVAEKMRMGLELQKSEAEKAFQNASDLVLSLRERILEEQGKARDADTKLLQYQQLVEEQKRIDEQIAKVSAYMNQLQLLINNDAERVRVSWLSRPIEAIRPTLDYRIRVMTTATYLLIGLPVAFAILLAIVRIVRWASRLGCTV